MKIRIFQINKDRDIDHIKFQSTKWLFSHAGYETISPAIYDKVFEGEVPAKDLGEVFVMFNRDDHPNAKAMHFLSVSDVIAVDESDTVAPGYYYCDTLGFTKVEFSEPHPKKEDAQCSC